MRTGNPAARAMVCSWPVAAGEATSLRALLRGRLLDFLDSRRHRTLVTPAQVEAATAGHKRAGVFYGQW